MSGRAQLKPEQKEALVKYLLAVKSQAEISPEHGSQP
jgi:hypothetical protein